MTPRTTPRSAPIRVLFVCTANISRSPFMEAYTADLDRRMAQARGDGVRHVEVASAGIPGFPGRAMDPQMAEELVRRGIPVGAHVSRSLQADLVAAADVVLTAERSHRAKALEEHPAAVRKVHVLGAFVEALDRLAPQAPQGGLDLVSLVGRSRPVAEERHDLADPYGHSPEAAARCARQIVEMMDTAFAGLVPDDRGENHD